MAAKSKTLPHSLESERQVIGAMLMDESACLESMEKLRAEHFYHPPHRVIFQALQAMTVADLEIELTTLAAYLDQQQKLGEAGGVAYIADVAGCSSTSTQVKSYIEIIIDRYQRRELWRIGGEIQESVRQADAANVLINTAESHIYSLANAQDHQPAISADRLATHMTSHMMEMEELGRTQKITGVHSGFPTIDSQLYGWQRRQLIICAARPGDGKTSLALNMALSAAISGSPVLFFSIEMTREEIGFRLLSILSGVDSRHIEHGKLDRLEAGETIRSISRLADLPLYIDDRPDITPAYIWSRTRHYKHRHGIKIVFVDYLQKITPDNERQNRYREVEDITQSLRILAKSADIPVFCNAQLNRSVEQRRGTKGPPPRPRLADLRESGAIEQDAYIVMFIHQTNKTEGEEAFELIIEKNRTGRLFPSIPFGFQKANQRINELTDREDPWE